MACEVSHARAVRLTSSLKEIHSVPMKGTMDRQQMFCINSKQLPLLPYKYRGRHYYWCEEDNGNTDDHQFTVVLLVHV